MTRMSLGSVSLVLTLVLVGAHDARAGQTAAAPARAASQGRAATTPAPPAPAQAARADERLPATANVRIEVALTDNLGPTPTTKTVSMLVAADGSTARIRSSQSLMVAGSYQPIGINVDASANVRPDNRILVRLTLSYTPQVAVIDAPGPKPASLDESMVVLLTDAKKTMLTQSADPQSDRKVTLEVTATVLR